MKRYIKNNKVTAGTGTNSKTIWYICRYPDRNPVYIDGFKTYGFSSEQECQQAIDDIYIEDPYYRERYPGLKPVSKITYSVYHD